MADRHDSSAAPQALRDLSGIVLGDHCFQAVLQRASEIAKRAMRGADEVSVTMKDGQPTTVASSGPLATEVDESQYAVSSGPCLQAIAEGEVVLVLDLATETRWPQYTPRAIATGVGSSLSIPLPGDGVYVGALNAYSRTANAFDGQAVKLGRDLAAYAAIVLNNAGLYFTATTRPEQLAEALQSRAVIDQAKGILMGARRCTAGEAFDILVRLSQQSQRKLRDVAQALIEDHARRVVRGASRTPAGRSSRRGPGR